MAILQPTPRASCYCPGEIGRLLELDILRRWMAYVVRMESLTVTLSLAVGEAPIFTTLGSRPPQDPRQRNPIDIN